MPYGWRALVVKLGNPIVLRLVSDEGSFGQLEMTSSNEPGAEYYRALALEITDFAMKAQLSEIRRELLELAERFRRMAIFVERRHPTRRGRAELE